MSADQRQEFSDLSANNGRRVYTSRWALTPGKPIANAVLALDGNTITFVGTLSECLRRFPDVEATSIVDLGESVLFPGLINCHVHTDFPSGKKLMFERGSMISWVSAALAARSDNSDRERIDNIVAALQRMQETATVAIGEISNDFSSLDPIINSGLACRYFAERLGFPADLAPDTIATLNQRLAEVNSSLPDKLRNQGLAANSVTIHPAPHAPYSTSAELITGLINQSELSSIHVAENNEETLLLANGSGPWRERLREIGRDDPSWKAPGLTPIEYLHSLGVLRSGVILVHATQVTNSDIALIADSGASVVLCPVSNEFIGVGTAPVEKIIAAGLRPALGTDSLGSNYDLNLFAEMRELVSSQPGLSPSTIWDMATINGAQVLGYSESLGSLQKGKSPGVFVSQLAPESMGNLDIETPEELLSLMIEKGDRQITKLAEPRISER